MANIKFQKACDREPQACPPIWMMRQAGRYHKHYQQLRRQHSFIELCKNPKLAAEVALGPIEDFDFDVSILFSDLLFPLEALGMGLDYSPAPQLGWHLQEFSDFNKMTGFDAALAQLQFQGEAVSATRARLPESKSLIGFVGSPWTLFVYAVAGSHKGALTEVKKRLHLYPAFAERVVPLLIENIHIQKSAGAEKVMVFDTAAGELSAAQFQSLVQPDLNQIAKSYPQSLGYYAKHIVAEHLDGLKGFSGFGFDHRWDLTKRFSEASGFVQGNFDQSLLFLDSSEFESCLRLYLEPFQALAPNERLGWVCGLGHGVLPQTPEENVRAFVRIVRESFA